MYEKETANCIANHTFVITTTISVIIAILVLGSLIYILMKKRNRMKKNIIKFLAKRKYQKKPLRSICLMSIVAIFVVFLFCGTILSTSISNGVNALSNRLGGYTVVPHKANIESVLLKGEPSCLSS